MKPPITRDTYFYDFDIQPIPRRIIEGGTLHGMCEEDLWTKIRTAVQRNASGVDRPPKGMEKGTKKRKKPLQDHADMVEEQ